jgi:hypothetical protein
MAMAGILVLTSAAIARSAAIQGAGFGSMGSGSAKVVFLDGAARPARGPVLDASGLYPGMKPRRSLITIENVGTAAVNFDVWLIEDGDGSGPSLLDPIQVTVTDPATHTRLYEGALSALRFTGESSLSPRESRSFAVFLSWPDGGSSDERYMGLSTSFSLVSQASAA